MPDFTYDEAIVNAAQQGGIDVDDVVGAGARLPIGRYAMKLIAVEPQESKANGKAPSIACRLEVLEGKHEGSDHMTWFTLTAMPPKKAGGKIFAPGVAEMKAAFAAVGKPLEPGMRFPLLNPAACAKLVAQRLGKARLDVLLLEEERVNKETSETITSTRTKILGLAGSGSASVAPAAPAAAAAEPQDDDLV